MLDTILYVFYLIMSAALAISFLGLIVALILPSSFYNEENYKSPFDKDDFDWKAAEKERDIRRQKQHELFCEWVDEVSKDIKNKKRIKYRRLKHA